MADIKNELSRMQDLMTYGRQNEEKKYNDNHLEYFAKGADNKMYGVIREGTKFYIKEAKKDADQKHLVAESFDYIGGWNNRKNNEYESLPKALKLFDMKMINLAEQFNKSGKVITETTNPDRKDASVIRTESMRNEINRQLQIMNNAQMINEGKGSCCCDPVIGEPAKKDMSKRRKGSISCEGGAMAEEPKKGVKAKASVKENRYVNIKGTWYDRTGKAVNEAEVLAWNRSNPEYMDKENGTKIGSSSPFTIPVQKKGGSLAESFSRFGGLHESEMDEPTKFEGYRQWDKGLPKEAGVGEVGDGKPFEENVNEDEDIDECDGVGLKEDTNVDNVIDDQVPASDDMGTEDDSEEEPEGDEKDTYDINMKDDDDDSEVMDILSNIKDEISALEDKVTDADFTDDNLYSDDDDDEENEFEVVPDDEGDDEEEAPMATESFRRRASRGSRMNEARLNDFGRHPSYRKRVMTLPSQRHNEMPGYRDWNDESTMGDEPYGQRIGNGAPFMVDTKDIQDAITEELRRVLKKK